MNNGIFISDTDGIVTKMYAKYHAQDNEMALTLDEYCSMIEEPMADTYSKKARQDKVFVVVSNGELLMTIPDI